MTDTPEKLPNARTACRWLNSNGWEVPERTFYRHVREGRVTKSKDGSFAAKALLIYAKKYLTSAARVGNESLQDQKLREEIGRIRAARKLKELEVGELEGALVRRVEVERVQVKSILFLKATLENWCYYCAPLILETSAGDPRRAPEVLALLLELRAQLMNSYANDTNEFHSRSPEKGTP